MHKLKGNAENVVPPLLSQRERRIPLLRDLERELNQQQLQFRLELRPPLKNLTTLP